MTQSDGVQKFCLCCLLAVMLLAVNTSAAVFVGTDTVGGTTAGDGTWGDINSWVQDFAGWTGMDPTGAPPAEAPVIMPATVLPSSSDNVYILGVPGVWPWASPNHGPYLLDSGYNAGTATINGTAQAHDVYVGYWGYTGALNVSPTGTLNASGTMVVTYATNDSYLTNEGTINVAEDLRFGTMSLQDCVIDNYGDINVGGNLYMGTRYNNVWNMHSGTVNVDGIIDLYDGGDYAEIYLDGGTVHAAGLEFDPWYYDNIDITEGVLILDGDWTGQMVINPDSGQPDQSQSYGLAWWTTAVPFEIDTENEHWETLMTAYGGAGTVMYDYDITNPDQTTIWAVPEPATMSLLGLGAVALLRRRK